MNVTMQKTKAEAAFLDAYPLNRHALPSAAWLDPLREAAYSALATNGLPHRRIEEWKWTDLRRALSDAYPPLYDDRRETVTGTVDHLLAEHPLAAIKTTRIVFVDGRLDHARSELDCLDGVEVLALNDAGRAPEWVRNGFGRLSEPGTDAIAALNTTFASDGALIRIADEVQLADPIELVSVSTIRRAVTLSVRHLVCLGRGARATLIETSLGSGGNRLCTAVTEAVIGEAACLDRIQIQNEGTETVHLAGLYAELAAGAVLRDFTASLGASLSRNHVFVTFGGPDGKAVIAGTAMLNGKQHSDTTLVVNHAVPDCASRELFKYVLDDEARGIFQGKLEVAPDAQRTDAKQQSHGLLLSERAEFDAKPELEIYADDVACGHGATAGEIDEDLLFYLMARGIPEAEAKSLLITAFVSETFAEVSDERIREALGELAGQWMTRKARNGDG